MYSPGEVSAMLGVPASTLRRWARQFGPFLSSGARKRKRQYNDHDISVFARVRDLAAQNVSMDDIAGELGGIIDQGDQASNQKALTLPGLLDRLDNFEEWKAGQDDRIARLQERVLRLEEERKKPWYKRLFGRQK